LADPEDTLEGPQSRPVQRAGNGRRDSTSAPVAREGGQQPCPSARFISAPD